MSDTPRTDAIVAEFSIADDAMIPPDFCRELERELSEAREKLETAMVALDLIGENSFPIVTAESTIGDMRDCARAALSAINPEPKPPNRV